MPTPKKGETEKAFVKRCVPIVLNEGTAKDGAQAAAICHSMFKQKHESSLTHFDMKTDKLEIYIYDEIDNFFGFSAQDLVNQLKNVPKSTTLEVYVNSVGGDVWEGLGIYNTLSAWAGDVVTICTGIAASMASVIFLAGKKRLIHDNAMLMIHSPRFSNARGKPDELRKAADLADETTNQFVSIYAGKTGQTEDQVKQWMDDETYFTAKEALQYGFATEQVVTPMVIANELSLHKLVAKLNLTSKDKTMDPEFKKWLKAQCEDFGFEINDLDDKTTARLKARWERERKSPPPADPPADPPLDPHNLEARRRIEADEVERVNAIQEYVLDHGSDPLNEEYTATLGIKAKTVRGLAGHAIRKGWSLDKFELEARRAAVADVGHAAVHREPTLQDIDHRALVASMCRDSMGIPSKREGSNGEYGYEVWFDEQTLDASDKFRGLGLLQVMDMCYQRATGHRYHGRLNTDAFIGEMSNVLFRLRAEGNTTWTSLNIFDDLANKTLWAAYENQRTTWQEWISTVSVSDFKTYNMYRLSMTGGYRRVGADGELKHGGFTDAKYTVAAETFGKIVGLSRRDIINDDLGALNSIMTALGVEGAKFLEELFYLTFLNNLTTIFPTAGTYNNYISGATTVLGVDGLTQGETSFMNQVDADGAPLLVDAQILLAGTALSVLADELYTQTRLQELQTANTKVRPDGNPHVRKFRPVISPYLNNTNLLQRTDVLGTVGAAIPGQSATQWFLLPTPRNAYGAIITGAFLNGNQRPTVEQSENSFNVLGLLWRAYHDAGAGLGDPKLGLMSKGAA